MLSKQTKAGPSFTYHPLADATITLFPIDGAPKQFTLKAVPFTSPPCAEACGGRVRVEMLSHNIDGDDVCLNQLAVSVNGKSTERYAITYPGRKVKKRFAKY